MPHAASLRPYPLDFDAGAFGAGQRMELFHPHARGLHPRIGEAGFGDALGQRFGEIDMARADDGADLRVISS